MKEEKGRLTNDFTCQGEEGAELSPQRKAGPLGEGEDIDWSPNCHITTYVRIYLTAQEPTSVDSSLHKDLPEEVDDRVAPPHTGNTTLPNDSPPVDNNRQPILPSYGTFPHMHSPKTIQMLLQLQGQVALKTVLPSVRSSQTVVTAWAFSCLATHERGFRKPGHRSARLGEKAVGVGVGMIAEKGN